MGAASSCSPLFLVKPLVNKLNIRVCSVSVYPQPPVAWKNLEHKLETTPVLRCHVGRTAVNRKSLLKFQVEMGMRDVAVVCAFAVVLGLCQASKEKPFPWTQRLAWPD